MPPERCERFSDRLEPRLGRKRRAELLARAEVLEPWLQGPFWLGGDIVLGGLWRSDERWVTLDAEIGSDISGKRVLDVGSIAGYDAFVFAKRGAATVLACEPFAFIEQARFLESVYRTGVDFRPLRWQDLDPGRHGRFDLVHCHGVLYHDRHPLGLVERLREMLAPGGTLILGSMMLGDPALAEHVRFVPGSYYGDPTWWWVPGRLAMRWMLESCGLEVVSEFGMTDGPPGEFDVVDGYFRAVEAAAR
jgi:tRNA (mo5U34)-methyltransferase